MAVRIESLAEPIPGYRLIDRLGGGGFGEVWKAEAPGGLLKAIKFVYGDLHQANGEGQRAGQELKALTRVKTVRHPYILSLERFDIVDGQLMIVMELADRNLYDRYKECRAQGLPGIPREELLRYLEEAAEALDLMNVEYQLQHLDIKPQNIFLVHNHIKVADFGLVKDLEGHQASVTGGVTPVYAAPETFDGYISRFSDQYSLAIVFQELLTGQRPFPGHNVRQLVLQHLQAQPNLNPLPPEDRPAVARALSKTPDERHPSCRDFVHALRGSAIAPVAIPIPPVESQTGPATATPPGTSTGGDTEAPTPNLGRPVAEPATGMTQSLRPTANLGQHTADVVARVPAAEARTPHRTAPTEIHGEGVLFPALVVGLGQTGLRVLQALREQICQRFGSLAALPQLRFLLIDTDPEVLRTALRPGGDGGLSASEILFAPLSRPTHYLKPKDGRIPVETWMEQKMLYRIPRSQVTGGVRALGRLAFVDNYRPLSRRMMQELEAALDPTALQQAVRHTRLGVRSNRPRVYVAAGLGGGTGSGAFLDVAYVLRDKLRQLGYTSPDVVGLLVAPAVEGGRSPNRARPLALVNAYAALTELRHYGRAGNAFSARYHEAEPALYDPAPPFHRCVLLPGAAEGDTSGERETVGALADYLFSELAQPAGRAIDLARASLSGPPWEQRGLFYHTFGLYSFRSPVRAVTREAARLVCRLLVERWMSKDSTALVEPVSTWVREQWEREGWGPASLFRVLREEATAALRQEPEAAFAAVLAPLARTDTLANVKLTDGPTSRSSGRSTKQAAPEPDPAVIGPAFTQLERLLGPPEGQEILGQTAALPEALDNAVETLVAAWGQRVAEFAVSLIEEPQFRLAGAEEAVRQIVRHIEKVLHEEEPRYKEATTRAAEVHARIRGLLEALTRNPRPRIPLTAPEAAELLRLYAAWRYEALLAKQRIGVYVSLRGHLSDELREINFCRVRLTELMRQFDSAEPKAEMPTPTSRGPGRDLFPPGCPTLQHAVDQLTGALTPDDMLELDGQVQAMLRERFTALVHVCLTTANVVRDLSVAMREQAEVFLEAARARMEAAAAEPNPEAAPTQGGAGAADLFLTQFPESAQAVGEILNAYDEAAPELGGSPSDPSLPTTELTVLAAPAGPAADALRALIKKALPDTEVVTANSADDVVVYRERAYQGLCPRELIGEAVENTYRQMIEGDSFTPHTRTDVRFPAAT